MNSLLPCGPLGIPVAYLSKLLWFFFVLCQVTRSASADSIFLPTLLPFGDVSPRLPHCLATSCQAKFCLPYLNSAKAVIGCFGSENGLLSFLIRLERRKTEFSSSRRIMRIVPVFILETHNPTNNKCLPKFVQTDNASSSIKTVIFTDERSVDRLIINSIIRFVRSLVLPPFPRSSVLPSSSCYS